MSMSGIYNRLELDIMQANELRDCMEMAHKYAFPAVVVHQGLTSDAVMLRGRMKAQFKIITPVDWPKGDNFGTLKFRGLSIDSLDVEGFEILLTGGKSETDTRNEAKALTEFIKNHLSDTVEIRFVLGTAMRDESVIDTLVRGLVGIRMPTMVRLDTQLRLQVGRANTDIHKSWIKRIRDIYRVPVKVSGNITGVRAVTGVDDAVRFAVNLAQARNIVKEFTQQPGELKTLLDDPEIDSVIDGPDGSESPD